MTQENTDRIQEEINRIERALVSGKVSDKQYCELFAARGALSWGLDEQSTIPPYETVLRGLVHPLLPEDALQREYGDNLFMNPKEQHSFGLPA